MNIHKEISAFGSMPVEHSNQQMYKQTLDAGEGDIR